MSLVGDESGAFDKIAEITQCLSECYAKTVNKTVEQAFEELSPFHLPETNEYDLTQPFYQGTTNAIL